MFNIYAKNKKTGKEIILATCLNEDKAESYCEAWGWSYDDGENSYWLSYGEI